MINKILAGVAAAACTAAIIGSITAPAHVVATRVSQILQLQRTDISSSEQYTAATAAPIEIRKSACARGWPYYDLSCLHDGRRSDGAARVVRVVTADRSVADRASQLRRYSYSE
jgi:hypothetical protein